MQSNQCNKNRQTMGKIRSQFDTIFKQTQNTYYKFKNQKLSTSIVPALVYLHILSNKTVPS